MTSTHHPAPPRAKGFRKTSKALLALSLTAATIGYASPASAATSTKMATMKGSFTHDGDKYGLSLTLMQFGGLEQASLSITKTVNPEGVRKSVSRDTMQLPVQTLSIAQNASTATFDTGPLESGGRIKVKYNDATNNSACNGHVRTSTGTWSLHPTGGKFEVATGIDAYGDTITKLPAKGTILTNDGECTGGGGGGGGGNPCPTASRSLYGSRSSDLFSFSATEDIGAETAQFSITTPHLFTDGINGNRQLTATVPQSKLTIADDLATATVSGEGIPMFQGTGTFAQNDQTDPGAFLNCGKDKKWRIDDRNGTIEGDFGGQFPGGQVMHTGQATMDFVAADKTIVRAR